MKLGTTREYISRAMKDMMGLASWTPKQPVAVDIYWGEYPVDLASLRPFLCIFKASEYYEDSRALDYSNQCKALGIKRGMYHFLHPGNIAGQAALFNSVWNKCGGTDLRPVVDVEINVDSIGVSRSTWAGQIKQFVNAVQAHTGKSPIIYTSLYFWEFTNAPAWATNYDLWAAWYPYEPDNYASLPANRTPPGFRRLALWQYADDGRSNGYLANDYNKLEPWLIDELGGSTPPPPPPDERVEYFRDRKIEVTHGRYDNGGKPFDYHIIKFARADIKRTYTTPGPITAKNLTENFLLDNGLHIACNMDEVITGTLTPKGWGVANGVTYKNTTEETGVQIDKNNNILGMSWPKLPGAWNIACGSNILVEDSVVQNISNPSADPRTILAYDNTHIYIVNVDGRLVAGEPGVTLGAAANWLVSRGIPNAHNLDGGGSSRSAILNDAGAAQVMNKPSETRYVINHIGWELNEGSTPPPPPEEKMKIKEYKKGVQIRVWKESEKPSPRELVTDTGVRLIPRYWANKEPKPPVQLYRVKRDQETDRWNGAIRNAAPAPAVWVVNGNTTYEMGRSVQIFCANLLSFSKFGEFFADLPTVDQDYIAKKFTSLYQSNRAFTNRHGFPAPNDPTPRANYITGEDLNAELPKFDKIRVCSDDLITGVEDGTDLVVDHFETVPASYDVKILQDTRVFRATIIYTDGHTSNFPQLDGEPVYVPLMSKTECRIPLKYLEKV